MAIIGTQSLCRLALLLEQAPCFEGDRLGTQMCFYNRSLEILISCVSSFLSEAVRQTGRWSGGPTVQGWAVDSVTPGERLSLF